MFNKKNKNKCKERKDGVLVFKYNGILNDKGIENLRDDIAEQVKSGIVILGSGVEYIGLLK